MPGNKFAVIRYRVIDRMLTNKYIKFPSLEALSEECGRVLYTDITPRTVREDIRAMKDDEGLGYFAPIKYSKSENGYYYSDNKYSINKIPLSPADMGAVDYAAKLLGQFAGSINFKNYAGAVDRLIDSLSINKKTGDPQGFPFILFDKAPYFKGGELLEQMVDIVKDRKVIRLGYLRFEEKETQYYTLHPYCIKEYKNRWYIIGYI
jgi:predicted DNA-binding transcriptional regulator YafY